MFSHGQACRRHCLPVTIKALKNLCFVGKIVRLVSALNVILVVNSLVGVVEFAAASILDSRKQGINKKSSVASLGQKLQGGLLKAAFGNREFE